MKFLYRVLPVLLLCGAAAYSQSNLKQTSTSAALVQTGLDAASVLQPLPWEGGVFLGGGLGTSGETDDHFLNGGIRVGKVLTGPSGPGILRGQFEYAAELMPYWQAFTPRQAFQPFPGAAPVTTGGTYSGISITPALLRWNFVRRPGHGQRVLPWVQGGGGLIWTNHKFPPNGARGTSVWNFTPQFGVGMHYFVRPKQSIIFAANAVHISNASLGDSNPGVNATVQFQIGYTWWK